MSDFSFETTVPVRFQDLDVVGHVNNAVYGTYLEEARSEYIEEVFEVDPAESGVVIAHLEIDYRQPVQEDTEVTVALRTNEPGTSSIPMDYEIRTEDGVAATAETVMVTIDYDTGETQPIPDSWRKRLAAFEEW
jgi:acyl-CoA thioester hydrolase